MFWCILVHLLESWQAQKTRRRGGGCGEGGVPSPPGEGAMPLPQKTVRFLASFGAFLELILLQLNCLSYDTDTRKSVSLDFGL